MPQKIKMNKKNLSILAIPGAQENNLNGQC